MYQQQPNQKQGERLLPFVTGLAIGGGPFFYPPFFRPPFVRPPFYPIYPPIYRPFPYPWFRPRRPRWPGRW